MRERGGAPGFSVEPGTVSFGVGIAALPTRHRRCCFLWVFGFQSVSLRVFANLFLIIPSDLLYVYC